MLFGNVIYVAVRPYPLIHFNSQNLDYFPERKGTPPKCRFPFTAGPAVEDRQTAIAEAFSAANVTCQRVPTSVSSSPAD